MTVLCLCCGQPAKRREDEMTPPQMLRALQILTGMGYDAGQLAHKSEYVESLNMTSPGFVAWLRSMEWTSSN